jgi:hypothetical protein
MFNITIPLCISLIRSLTWTPLMMQTSKEEKAINKYQTKNNRIKTQFPKRSQVIYHKEAIKNHWANKPHKIFMLILSNCKMSLLSIKIFRSLSSQNHAIKTKCLIRMWLIEANLQNLTIKMIKVCRPENLNILRFCLIYLAKILKIYYRN